MDYLQNIKQRFRIIGNNSNLCRSIEKAIQVSSTDISVLVIGESGVGKEFIPKIIHQLSPRKHNSYIAVNCGAIPEGTIDSELFGHEKGAFTGATNVRKGYFESANGGTIFLDEIGELPLSTQVKILRMLESGEFIKVGSSNIQKIHVRIVAATNINLLEAIKKGKFREDLYYRLNIVQIDIPPLRNRREDIELLFRKFSSDFAEKYKMPPIKLKDKALKYIENYSWPGNIRQLKNFSEQLSIIETKREISLEKVKKCLIEEHQSIIPIISKKKIEKNFSNERDLLYKILFDMRKDINDLKNLILQLIQNKNNINGFTNTSPQLVKNIFEEVLKHSNNISSIKSNYQIECPPKSKMFPRKELKFKKIVNKNESVILQDKELEIIQKVLIKNKGKRKVTAKELGISERTLYRKIKQHDL